MKKNIIASLLAAIGILTSSVICIPVGVAKCYPIQHTINIISAVLLGPVYSVITAFLISLIRLLSGTGTILAFPGSMIGALLAGLLYQKFEKDSSAVIGEVIGTGIIGAMVAVPISNLFLGTSKAAFALIIPFIVSSLGGAVISIALLKSVSLKKHLDKFKIQNAE